MKTLSVLALSVIVGLSVLPRVDAAAQSNQTRDRSRGDQVCVYKDINYQGPEQCYGPGEISNLGTLRQSISSMRIYGRATLTVYENTDFRGRSAQFTSDVPDLGRQMMAGNTAWSDHIDSLRIGGNAGTSNASSNSSNSDRSRGDQVCVYADANYQGSERCLGVGEVASLGALRPGISSIRVYGRATLTVYESTNFRGSSAQFTSDVPDLGRQIMSGNTTWNDRINSVRISDSGTSNVGGNRDRARGDQVCVYKDINYQGLEQCYGAGDVANLGALRQSISSVRVSGRAAVTVYESTDFRGRSAQFTSDVPDLGRQMIAGNTAWSDHIDSLRITSNSGTYNAGGGSGNTGDYSRNSPRNSQAAPRDGICAYELPNYQGRSECWNQGQSVANLARQDNGSSPISSIRLFGRAIAVVYQGANYQGESMTVDRDIPDLAAVAVRNNRGNARGQGQENSNGRGRGNARGTTWDQQISSIHVQEQR
jgi:hypothetical protein